MQCNYCHHQFNHSQNIPRLLIFCGHSLCEMCCHQLHTNNRIQCPQCSSSTFIEQINFLPKNLALLKVNNFYSSTNSSQSEAVCQKHQKKYEAFCEKQKVLLCVDCILQDGHRNHDMDSIKNSHSKHLEMLQKEINSLEKQLEQIDGKDSKNKQNRSISSKNYGQCKESIITYFSEIKSIVQQEQNTLLSKIQEQYESTLSKYEEKEKQYTSKMTNIEQCLSSVKGYHSLSEIEFLQSYSNKISQIHSTQTATEDPEKVLSLMHTKNKIADTVIKNIEKNFKVQVATQSHVHAHKVESVSNNVNAKNFKKNQIGNIPVYKNIPKKPVKKQSQTSVVSMPQSAVFSPSTNMNSNQSSTSHSHRPINHPSKNRNSQNIQSKSISQQKKNSDKKSTSIQKKPLNKYDFNARCCDVSIVEPKQSMFNSFLSNMTSFLMTQKKSIYVFGGFDPENSQILKFSLSSLSWEKVGKMNTLRSKFGCIVNSENKQIMMFGGKRGKQRIADSQFWLNGEWKPGMNLKKKKSGFGVVCIEENAYFIGGNDGDSILNSVEVLNIKTGQWKRKQSMIENRDELAVCVGPDNKIYAIGGFGGKNNEPLKSAEVYDPKTDEWTLLPAMKTPRRALAAAALADGIYAIGGFDGEKYLNTVEKFEQGQKQWVKIASLNKARCTHSAVTIFDSQEILIFGGFDEVALDSVEKYSLISNQWESLPSMPGPRFMHCSVLIDE